MIMGDICVEHAHFVMLEQAPGSLDQYEPIRVTKATKDLGLSHVVITSVDRDDHRRWS